VRWYDCDDYNNFIGDGGWYYNWMVSEEWRVRN
jgi:hypothetical protein